MSFISAMGYGITYSFSEIKFVLNMCFSYYTNRCGLVYVHSRHANFCNRLKRIKTYVNAIINVYLRKYIGHKHINIICTNKYKMYRLSAKYLSNKKFATVLTFVYDDIYAEIFISYINIAQSITSSQNVLEEILYFVIHSIINTICNIDANVKIDLYNRCIHVAYKLLYK